MKKQISLLVLALSFFTQMAIALPITEFPASPWTEEKSYLDKTTGKFGFGLMNVVGGWTALSSEYREKPNANFVGAFGRSILRTVTNEVGGALHLVTFPFPFDIRLPGGGASFE